MSNDVAFTLKNLTYDSTDLQRSDLSIHLEVTLGLDEVPSARGRDTIIPTLTGQVSRLGKLDTLDIELSGIVQGQTGTEAARRASFRDLAEELKTLFMPGGAPATLTGLGADGVTYSINAKPVREGALRWGPQTIPGFRELTVLLVSLDPAWETAGS